MTLMDVSGGHSVRLGCFTTLGCRRQATQDINATREMWRFFVRMSTDPIA